MVFTWRERVQPVLDACAKMTFEMLYAVVFSKLLGHFCVSQTNSKTLDCSWLGLDGLF